MLAKQMEKVTLMVGSKEAKQHILTRATFQKAMAPMGRLPKFLCQYHGC